MSRYAFLDVETTGLFPREGEVGEKPQAVQIALRVFDIDAFNKEGFKAVRSLVTYLKLEDGVSMSEGAYKTHGLSPDFLNKMGVKAEDGLRQFLALVEDCDYIVGHNVAFDIKVINSTMERVGLGEWKPKSICTMQLGKQYKLSNCMDDRYPSLMWLHETLCKRKFANSHDALADVEACCNVFCALGIKGYVKL